MQRINDLDSQLFSTTSWCKFLKEGGGGGGGGVLLNSAVGNPQSFIQCCHKVFK